MIFKIRLNVCIQRSHVFHHFVRVIQHPMTKVGKFNAIAIGLLAKFPHSLPGILVDTGLMGIPILTPTPYQVRYIMPIIFGPVLMEITQPTEYSAIGG